MKRLVWNTYIGEEIGKIKCMCCKLSDITQLTFDCGHIISESTGGELSIDNLIPICHSCNLSMGSQNLNP
jgi:5-methylcytosine-specific restriction endonuclease McrA